MKAILKSYRQSPRKVRLVADYIRGKNVEAARILLETLPKRASSSMKKLLLSAVANAKNLHGLSQENLYVKEIRVDEGPTMKRHMPRAFGRVAPIRKRTSHISIVLAERGQLSAHSAQGKAKN